MKLRQLAITLSKLPPHPCSNVDLEQYQTEGDLAALWLANIDGIDGLNGKTVIDLGSGNGILGYGAKLLGADVTFVECDPDAAELCRQLGNTIEGRVEDVDLPNADLVITNPPWGFQNHGADRVFVERALECSPVLHIMHNAAATHLPKGELVLEGEFRMPAIYSHHNSRMGKTAIRCWRITRG
ncbi:MAG: methyltransferase [Candidatus Poseidoniaceae archaeon]|jgi:predicted RNA methylase|nr:methyltransferase [Candidatus Poseidoniaceae archaeon]